MSRYASRQSTGKMTNRPPFCPYTMRAEIVADMIYLEGPEYPGNSVLRIFFTYKVFWDPQHGNMLGNPLPVGPGQQTTANFANPFPTYSLKKRPKPQICPKFVPAIVLGGSSQTEIWKICQNLKNGNFRTNLDKFPKFQSP